MEPNVNLVKRVRSGDVEAFGDLIARYERTLLAFALSKLHDIHAAEDVVQTTALLAFRKFGTLRDEHKFGNWLIKIAQSQVKQAFRTRSVLTNRSLESIEHPDRLHWEDSIWIEHEYLLDLISQLPDDEQLLIGMRYFDGQSMSEIAQFCSRPIGTVTKQLSRAIAHLRSLFEKEDRE